MTDYTKATNFATKDALVTGDPLKVVKGTEIDDEFNAIEDSIETKADLASPTFTGVPKAPTAATGTNTTQLATTAFVKDAIDTTTYSIGTDDLVDGSVTQDKLADNSVCSAQIIDNCVTADELNVDGDGTAGQVLISDGDGSFSWEDQTDLTDLSGGTTGTTGTPPVGALAYGYINRSPTSTVKEFGAGFGDEVTLSASLTFNIRYNWDRTYGFDTSYSGAIMSITEGTWRYLGGYPRQAVSEGGDTYDYILMQRVS